MPAMGDLNLLLILAISFCLGFLAAGSIAIIFHFLFFAKSEDSVELNENIENRDSVEINEESVDINENIENRESS